MRLFAIFLSKGSAAKAIEYVLIGTIVGVSIHTALPSFGPG